MLHRLVWCATVAAALASGVRADSPSARQAAGPVAVSAAVSLAEALEDAAKAYAAAGGGPVSFNFAASNVLARQIVNGAPVDVFISADAAQMEVVEREGLLAPRTKIPLLGNQLALVVAAGLPGAEAITSVQSLAADSVRRIAVGDPEAVPAGRYARQYLEKIGLWQTLQPKLVPALSVRGALTAVSSGGADAGFVYVTDARGARNVRVAAVISGADAPRIVYLAGLVKTGKHLGDAARFLTFLRSPAGFAVFERYGFNALSR